MTPAKPGHVHHHVAHVLVGRGVGGDREFLAREALLVHGQQIAVALGVDRVDLQPELAVLDRAGRELVAGLGVVEMDPDDGLVAGRVARRRRR